MNHLLNYIDIIDNENKNKTFPIFFNTTNHAKETYFDHKSIAYDDNSNKGIEEKIRHFGDDEEIILQSSNTKKNLSTSVVNSMTFISDEHLIKPNTATSNDLFWNTGSFSQTFSNPLTQKKSITSSCFMYQKHLVDVPLSTIASQNIPIKTLVPIIFHDYQIVEKVPKEILFERETSKSHTTFLSNGNPVKASVSETLESFPTQVQSFYTAFAREVDFDTFDCFLQKCEPEKIDKTKTKTQFQCSKLHLQKHLHHLNKATNFSAIRIQRVIGIANDKANEICNLSNVLLKSSMKNNLGEEKPAWSKFLHPADEFSSMPNLVGFKHNTLEISLQNNSQNASLRLGKAFEDKVMYSFDCLKTLSCRTECFQSYSHGNIIEDTKSESWFRKRMDNSSTSSFELPISYPILKFQEISSNNNVPLVENKDNNNDAVPFVQDRLFNKPLSRVFEAQEQSNNNKYVTDNNNYLLKESEEDSSTLLEGFSWDEGSLIEEDQFYDCLEDISLDKSEKNSEILFSTDDDFVAIQDAATFPESHFQEPVIFSYVEEDTHEVDEILIYPKIYMERISKNSNKILTSEEILPKLLESSKFYDGQPIGIFTHVRGIRKAIQNEISQKIDEYSIPASTYAGNREPDPLPQFNTLKRSKLNKVSVKVGVKKQRRNRKKPIKRNKVKITSKQKLYSESNRFSQTFRSSNIPQIVKNKSLQQGDDYCGIPFNNSIEKYYKSANFQQEYKSLTSIPVSSSSKQNYEIHEAGDQLVKEIPSRRQESAIDKFEFSLFQQRTFNNKSREPSELQSGVCKSSCETSRIPCYISKHTGPPKSIAVLQKPSVVRCSSSVEEKSSSKKTTSVEICRKAWGDSIQAGPHKSKAVLEKQILVRCSPSVEGKSSSKKTTSTETCRKACGDSTYITSAILEEANCCSMTFPTIGVQKNDPSRQKLRISIRKDLKVEDIVSSDFRSHFCFYAKMGHRLRSGSAIPKSNSNYWLKRTGVVVDSRSRQTAEECFSFIAKSKLVLNIYDYVHYLIALSKRTKVCLSDLIRQMKSGDISTQRQKNASFPDVGCTTDRSSLPPRSRFTLSTHGDSRPRKTSYS
ncbi:hypothetical protein JTE90_013123 [Oedothorax gibbosus]|uniref:Uncharacterized protein n=1 Tax=Oedothorax gibbosus TaxID=931172 RepID=A0AAV6U4P8_9ARAC|nr:hypothetical protein JTE90_013123 [Oedothorax gibbosus]